MSGHSKWSTIKRAKGATDAKRGQLFTKLTREITIAVREGGGDVDFNPRLRLAVHRARENNMPVENIERAIKRSSGADGETTQMEEIIYEGYGPGGVAILLHIVTENRNRAAADVRSAMSRNGGNLGEAGCVSWIFNSKGILTMEISGAQAEEMALKAIDEGAEDFFIEKDLLEINCQPGDLEHLRQVLDSNSNVRSAEVSQVPTTTVPLDSKTALQTLRLLDRLEDLEDVQRVYTNADFPDDTFEQYETEG
jgi:YebC/PmpR family DNA-binding regulatory protein